MKREIRQSSKYDDFKFIEKNRSINDKHVKYLMKKIQIANLTHIDPIIVNDQLEVVDGQHRLMACKNLGEPFYYIIDNDYSADHIVMLNTGNLNWSVDNWINMYASEGKEEYMKFRDFQRTYDLKSSLIVLWLDLPEIQLTRSCIKDGTLQFYMSKQSRVSFEACMRLCEYLEEIDFKPKKVLAHSLFHRACKKFFSYDVLDIEWFFDRLVAQPLKLRYAVSWQQYFDMFVEIYNFHSKKKRISVLQQGSDRILV